MDGAAVAAINGLTRPRTGKGEPQWSRNGLQRSCTTHNKHWVTSGNEPGWLLRARRTATPLLNRRAA
jgi:hypothetical protein